VGNVHPALPIVIANESLAKLQAINAARRPLTSCDPAAAVSHKYGHR
jgi:hypothetical protein